MPTTTLRGSDLPILFGEHFRIEVEGAVTILAGAKVTNPQGVVTLDRDVTFYVNDPIPLSKVDHVKLLEAKRGGLVYLASEARALILESAGVGLLIMFCPSTGEWRIHCRSPLAEAISALNHRCAHE